MWTRTFYNTDMEVSVLKDTNVLKQSSTPVTFNLLCYYMYTHTQIRNVLNLINMFYLMNSSVPNFHGRFKSGYEININITRLFDYMYASPVMYMCYLM